MEKRKLGIEDQISKQYRSYAGVGSLLILADVVCLFTPLVAHGADVIGENHPGEGISHRFQSRGRDNP